MAGAVYLASRPMQDLRWHCRIGTVYEGGMRPPTRTLKMDRTIHRRYGLSPNEVRTAIVAYLKARDFPAPDSADFNLTVADGGGVVIYWSEDISE